MFQPYILFGRTPAKAMFRDRQLTTKQAYGIRFWRIQLMSISNWPDINLTPRTNILDTFSLLNLLSEPQRRTKTEPFAILAKCVISNWFRKDASSRSATFSGRQILFLWQFFLNTERIYYNKPCSKFVVRLLWYFSCSSSL